VLFSRPPRFLASPVTYNGSDNSSLRYQSLTTTTVQVKVEEDTTYDAETKHMTEVVHYLAIQGSGTLTDTAPESEITYYSFIG
jgi:hypothetical protein